MLTILNFILYKYRVIISNHIDTITIPINLTYMGGTYQIFSWKSFNYSNYNQNIVSNALYNKNTVSFSSVKHSKHNIHTFVALIIFFLDVRNLKLQQG